MRYVIASKNEDGVRVFGTFRDRAKAEALAERINERIESIEDAEHDAWSAGGGEGLAPDGHGRCGVLIVHKWSVRRALRFALGELDS